VKRIDLAVLLSGLVVPFAGCNAPGPADRKQELPDITLSRAAAQGSPNQVRLLIQSGADAGKREGAYALMTAISEASKKLDSARFSGVLVARYSESRCSSRS